VCQELSVSLIVDAMSSFGALELNVRALGIDAVVASSNKCFKGVASRGGAHYRQNMGVMLEGMRKLGFRPLLPGSLPAPIIMTFHMPTDAAFNFDLFYNRLAALGFVIYPDKLTLTNSFRIGCIGRLGEAEMSGALAAISATLSEMNVNLTHAEESRAA